MLVCFNSFAAGLTDSQLPITLILDDSSTSHLEFYEQFQKIINETSSTINPAVTRIDIDALSDNKIGDENLIITVGTKSFEQVLKKDLRNTVWGGLIPEQSYRSLINTYDNLNTRAWFIDQPLERRVALIKAVLPEAKKIGLMFSELSEQRLVGIDRGLSEHGYQSIIESVGGGQSSIKVSQTLMDEIDVLFTIVDPQILNRKTAKGILLSAYRKKVPVIAYSNSYVQAGALAAVYSTPPQLAQHLAEDLIVHLSDNQKIADFQYPKYFSVSLNRRVARSLSINLASKEKIYQQIQ